MTAPWWVPVAGLVVGLLVLGFNLYKHRVERPRLRIHCYVGHLTMRFEGDDGGAHFESEAMHLEEPPFLALEISNPGRGPVVISKVGGEYKGGQRFEIVYPAVPLPKRMEPGERIYYGGPLALVNDRLRYLAAWDAVGKRWKASSSAVRRLKRTARTERANHQIPQPD
jgi:hypothetical protein